MIDIGWINTLESELLQKYEGPGYAMSPYFAYDPEPYKRIPTNKKTSHKKFFTHCPANVQFNQNMYVIRAPLDVELEVAKMNDQGMWDCQPKDGKWKLSPDALKKYVMFEGFPDARVDVDKPHLQIRTPYTFYADEPVTMQLLPVVNTYEFNPPGICICGEFDIHAWHRPVQWGFEWWDTNKPLIIKRGQPLYYVKFVVHKDPTEKVRLVRLKANENTTKPILRANNVSHFMGRTFDLFNIAKKYRPKKFITKENLWTPDD